MHFATTPNPQSPPSTAAQLLHEPSSWPQRPQGNYAHLQHIPFKLQPNQEAKQSLSVCLNFPTYVH